LGKRGGLGGMFVANSVTIFFKMASACAAADLIELAAKMRARRQRRSLGGPTLQHSR
jgi:hypothetical protein